MQLLHSNDNFYFRCSLADNGLARRAGLAWDRRERMWATPFASIASRLAPFCDCKEGTVQLIKEKRAEEEKTYKRSIATYSKFVAPTPEGLTLMPFQKAGVEFLAKKKRALLADVMGLGKSAQCIALWNTMLASYYKHTVPVLVVCPASLKRVWLGEWQKWAIGDYTIDIATTKHFPKTDIVIINYDIVAKMREHLHEKWALLILDECHYLKNPKAQRTKEILGGKGAQALSARRIVALTGTPILNKPIELYTVIKYLMPNAWPRKHDFALRYCNAKKGPFGWDYGGSSNLEDLQKKLRSTIMIRRLKEDVLHDLPPKVRQIIELDPDSKSKKVLKKEAKFWEEIQKGKTELTEEEYDEVVRTMAPGARAGFEEISALRHELAEIRIPHVVEHIKECLSSTDKLVVFAHHKVLLQALTNEFGVLAVSLCGDTPNKERQRAIDSFQTNPKVKLFIGSIKAAGVGITLTASQHVIFAELDWVPGNVTQAEDRCHRIGTKGSVLIQHLVFTNSFDATMAKTIVRKQRVIEKALNSESFDFLK